MSDKKIVQVSLFSACLSGFVSFRVYSGREQSVRFVCHYAGPLTKQPSVQAWSGRSLGPEVCLAGFPRPLTSACAFPLPLVAAQWDIRSGEIVQEYDRHLGAVNTIVFVDENRRFVSTSDDKSLRVWEW